jgi:hypothetical protein
MVECFGTLCSTAMASTPSLKPPRTEADYALSFKKWDTLSELVGQVIKWGGLCFIAYMGYKTVGVLAGKGTFADIAVRLIANAKVSKGIILLLTGSGWAYGLGQRSLRRKNIERLVPAKNAREKELDPKRTSSNLTGRGTTPPSKRRR